MSKSSVANTDNQATLITSNVIEHMLHLPVLLSVSHPGRAVFLVASDPPVVAILLGKIANHLWGILWVPSKHHDLQALLIFVAEKDVGPFLFDYLQAENAHLINSSRLKLHIRTNLQT